jgi:hypothetical protein
MQPQLATRKPAPRRWQHLAGRVGTAAILLAVPLLAVTHLWAGTSSLSPADNPAGLTDRFDVLGRDNPLTFDAPASTLAKASARKKGADVAAAKLAAPSQDETTVLDDWEYTQFFRGNQYVPPPRIIRLRDGTIIKIVFTLRFFHRHLSLVPHIIIIRPASPHV